jgi:alpha-galactosidase
MHALQIHITRQKPEQKPTKQILPFQEGYQDLGDMELLLEISSAGKGQRWQLFVSCAQEIIFRDLLLQIPFPAGLDWQESMATMFVNGFQSWTDSREFSLWEKIPSLLPLARAAKLHRFGDYTFLPEMAGARLYSYTYTYFRGRDEDVDNNRSPQNHAQSGSQQSVFFLGSLYEDNGYTRFVLTKDNSLFIQKELLGHKCTGKELLLDIWFGPGQENELFAEFFRLGQGKKESAPPRTGWTSWYNYYTDISEQILVDNLEAFRQHNIPIDLFQIDDGYQTAVGDWLSLATDKFPSGMEELTRKIHGYGYQAGLWLAPFICEKDAQIKKDHPEWLLHDDKGKLVPVGWNPLWSGNFYAMDIYNEGFRRYLQEVFATVLQTWGFDMVKLDFLYGAAIIPQRGKSRGEIMHEAMAFLREIIDDKLILGCGVPLGPSFGQVDYCRIGSDVAPKWEDRLLSTLHYRERVSTINSLTSTIGRHHLNGPAFGNDPDVFILRQKKQKMSWEQRRTLFLLNNVFGSLVFTSDYIADYQGEVIELYKAMFPLLPKEIIQAQVYNNTLTTRFHIGEQTYLALANLSNKEKWLNAPEGWFFSQEHSYVRGGAQMRLRPYHTAILLQIQPEPWTVAGTTGHIFPGSEIQSLSVDKKKRSINELRTKEPFLLSATALIKVPDGQEVVLGGQKIKPKQVWNELFIVEVPLAPRGADSLSP